MNEIQTFLTELSACTGVSGQEEGAAGYIRRFMEPFSHCRTTPLGSLICTVGEGRGSKLMTASHMDEIGFIVTHIEDSGFLRIANVGGIDRKLYASACVTVHTARGGLPGVIASTPPHLRSGGDKALPAADEVSVDVGLSGERARELIRPGDRVTMDVPGVLLADGSVSAKALDDRACCAAVMLAARELAGKDLPLELDFVFTTMEEVGSQGAQTAAAALQPDYAVALDVSFAVAPDVSPNNCGKLGGGPMLGIAPVLDNAETDRIIRLAREAELPLQYEVMSGSTGTDADEIAAAGRGVRTVLLSIPQKYMHTPVEVVDPEDVRRTALLLERYITDLAARLEGGYHAD